MTWFYCRLNQLNIQFLFGHSIFSLCLHCFAIERFNDIFVRRSRKIALQKLFAATSNQFCAKKNEILSKFATFVSAQFSINNWKKKKNMKNCKIWAFHGKKFIDSHLTGTKQFSHKLFPSLHLALRVRFICKLPANHIYCIYVLLQSVPIKIKVAAAHTGRADSIANNSRPRRPRIHIICAYIFTAH